MLTHVNPAAQIKSANEILALARQHERKKFIGQDTLSPVWRTGAYGSPLWQFSSITAVPDRLNSSA